MVAAYRENFIRLQQVQKMFSDFETIQMNVEIEKIGTYYALSLKLIFNTGTM